MIRVVNNFHTDAADVMPFDGGEGDYRLEISTPDGSCVGYFTMERISLWLS